MKDLTGMPSFPTDSGGVFWVYWLKGWKEITWTSKCDIKVFVLNWEQKWPTQAEAWCFCCVSLSCRLASSYDHFPRSGRTGSQRQLIEKPEKQWALLLITKPSCQHWLIYIILHKGRLLNVLNAILLACFNHWFCFHLTFLCRQHLWLRYSPGQTQMQPSPVTWRCLLIYPGTTSLSSASAGSVMVPLSPRSGRNGQL